ncbi:MAG: tetratricopeptide repeat protein [Acidobacteriota bacterium]
MNRFPTVNRATVNRATVNRATVNRALIRILLPLLMLGAGWRVLQQLKAALVVRAEPSPASLERAIDSSPEEPSYHFKLAIVYRDLPELRDLRKAKLHLDRAIELNPYNWRYRRELAQLYELSGLEQEAEQALLTALRLNPRSSNYRWRLANFYLRRGALEQAIPQLEAATAADSQLLGPALGLLLKAGGSYAQLDRIWPDDRMARLGLLNLLSRRQPTPGEPPALDFLRRLWGTLMADFESLPIRAGSAFVERLLGERRFDEARQRWVELVEAGGLIDSDFASKANYVWNGEFEAPIGQGILDWPQEATAGDAIALAAGEGWAQSTALRLTFDSRQNPRPALTGPQILIDPGSGYRLRFRARARDLSSDPSLRLEVLDGPSRRVLWHTEPLQGSFDWLPFEGSFEVDSASHWIDLRLRWVTRQPDDNPFRGILWLDSVKVTQR